MCLPLCRARSPQLYFDVDRDRAKFLGIPLSDIFSTMKAYLGSVYVNDFNMFNRIYRVYIQAEAPYRATRDNLDLFFVRSKDEAMGSLDRLGYDPIYDRSGNDQAFQYVHHGLDQRRSRPGI